MLGILGKGVLHGREIVWGGGYLFREMGLPSRNRKVGGEIGG